MAAFREALLDPESYLSALAVPVTEDDLSGRFRAALPAARNEMNSTLASGNNTERLTPSTTLRQGAGEIVDGPDLKPKRSHRGLFFVGVATLTGVAVASVAVRQKVTQVLTTTVARTKASAVRVDVSTIRHQTNRLLAEAVALTRPSSVRVTFSSDPEEAIVARSDGFVLGVTPLSVDIPLSDKAVEYVVRKDGYVSEVSSFVPNVPSHILALLKNAEQPAVMASPVEDPPITDVWSTESMTVRTEGHHPRPRAQFDEVSADDALSGNADAVLPPSAE
jgi:hypothetical protein